MNTLFWPMVTFVFVGATTPGPNNIMVTASGANFGYCRTLPHMLGITAVTIWCLMGKMIGQLLKSKAALRAFNWTMAALLLMSIGMLYV